MFLSMTDQKYFGALEFTVRYYFKMLCFSQEEGIQEIH
jgi:hypothetical protein